MPQAEPGDTRAFQYDLAHRFTVVDLHGSAHGLLEVPALVTEWPARARPPEIERQAVVIPEISRRSRDTAAFQIAGRRADDQPALRQLPRLQGAVREIADADRDIGFLLQEVDDLVGETEIERQIGIALNETRDRRRHEHGPERQRCIDPDTATRHPGRYPVA